MLLVDFTDPQLDPIPIEDREMMVGYATRRILTALTHARYDTNADGRPVDKTVELRLQYAIIEQALEWHRWKINPSSAGADSERTKSTTALGPASISYDFRDNVAASRAQARDGIAPAAYAWLRPLLHQPAY